MTYVRYKVCKSFLNISYFFCGQMFFECQMTGLYSTQVSIGTTFNSFLLRHSHDTVTLDKKLFRTLL